MKTKIAIIGGGLTGLALADHLQQAGEDFQLFESRDRFGGRIYSRNYGGTTLDLGPSWFWPGQHHMEALVQRLGLNVFEQFSTGAVVYESESGPPVRNAGYASMPVSQRLVGGMSALIEGLSQNLPIERLHLNSPLTKLEQSSTGSPLTLHFEEADSIECDHVVIATPPRIAAELNYSPILETETQSLLRSIPTWMAGNAKFFAVYDRPFWREAGLSGDAMSRRGPLLEIHDASGPTTETPGALFGFLGVPAEVRKNHEKEITQAAVNQLTRIFGPQAQKPMDTFYQDWAFENQTASTLDHNPLTHHPAYGKPDGLKNVWQNRLHFCSTELADDMGGYLEGALVAARQMANAFSTMKGA